MIQILRTLFQPWMLWIVTVTFILGSAVQALVTGRPPQPGGWSEWMWKASLVAGVTVGLLLLHWWGRHCSNRQTIGPFTICRVRCAHRRRCLGSHTDPAGGHWYPCAICTPTGRQPDLPAVGDLRLSPGLPVRYPTDRPKVRIVGDNGDEYELFVVALPPTANGMTVWLGYGPAGVEVPNPALLHIDSLPPKSSFLMQIEEDNDGKPRFAKAPTVLHSPN